DQYQCLVYARSLRIVDDSHSIQTHRRTRRHRAGRRIPGIGSVRLHQRSKHFRGWRHDPVSRFRHRRLGLQMTSCIRDHWPEYLRDAAGLGAFMIPACVFTVLVMHPASPGALWMADPVWKGALIGIGRVLPAIGLIYTPWGKQSGAHYNPSVTIAFYRLG